MTRIAIDCEFNGFGGTLISLALVAEDGNEWYQVMPSLSSYDPWVKEHVLPFLDKEPLASRDEFRMSMFTFLNQYKQPTIVADWYADLLHFFSLFAGEDHSRSIGYPCHTELLPRMEFEPSMIPHNALEDARAIMRTLLK